MTDEISTPQPDEPSATETVEIPAWARPLVQDVAELKGQRTQIGRDLGRIRAKIKDAPDEAPTTPAQMDLESAMRLGALTASLSAEAQDTVQSMLAAGKSPAEVLQLVELTRKLTPAQQTVTPAPKVAPVPGVAAVADRRGDAGYPLTVAEFIALKTRDPQRYQQLREDENFDPSKLRPR